MKNIFVLVLIMSTLSYANVWNTPDYGQTQTTVQGQPRTVVKRAVVEEEVYPVYRTSHYHPGRPVTTAVEGAANTVDAAAQGVANILHSDRPVRSAVDGAVDTADTAVEGAANVVRSLFN